MTKLKIKVTEEILRKSQFCGTIYSTEPVIANCAIALAVRDIFPNALVADSMKSCDTVILIGEERELEIELPLEAQMFVSAFDISTPEERTEMDELEFEVEIPEEVLKTIDIEEVKNILKTSSTLELIQ